MMVSQKCQYALRVIFELTRRVGEGPVRISDLASYQAIPGKFLELILCELKQGGFVESRRGRNGGYLLTRSKKELTVGEIIRFIDGPIGPVRCITTNQNDDCSLYGHCALMGMWYRAQEAVAQVYDKTTFNDLLQQQEASVKPNLSSLVSDL